VKKETEVAALKTGVHNPPLNVEIHLREEDAGSAEPGSEHAVEVTKTRQSWVIHVSVLAAVLVIAGIYVGVHIGKGWVPADDGTLSQSALRVMQGQLPHSDFGEVYTGGLSFIHALAFRVLGVNLMSLRICVFLFFLTWVPAVYYIAQRFISPIAAGFITLLAVAWSYPNYPAAMPSWYNLFFATFGAAAMLRYLDVRRRRWLVIAGVCGGISILIKVIGAYYIAGILLFLAFFEQSESHSDSHEQSAEGQDAKTSWLYRLFNVGALLLFLATLLMVLRAKLGIAELYEFVLPSAAVVSLMLLGERGVRVGTGQRFRTIFRVAIPFLCGLAAPIIVFLIPYARSGGIARFFWGVTSSAVDRAAGLGVIRPLGPEKLLYVLPLVAVLAAAMYWDQFQGKAIGAALALGAVTCVVRAAYSFDFLYGIWCSVVTLTPVVVFCGVALVWFRNRPDARTRVERQQVVLLVSLAATCSLTQYPFAAAIYLSYMVPLTLLAIVAIVSTGRTQRGTYALASVVGMYLVFAVVSLVPLYIYEITSMVGTMYTMESPRAGGLKIEEAVFFDELAYFLHEHSPNGLMFAVNDCPELYFLSGLKSVWHDDTGASPEEILKVIQNDDLNLVVINDAPYFPGAAMRPDVKAEVSKRFPHSTRFGIFNVFWKR
jgi:Dolichyl-phosphate-mannose-protein mannosyltransferase